MSNFLCHDFKTPRTDTSRRLPNSFRAVPVAFYLSLVVGAYFVTMDVISYRGAKQDKTKFDALKAQHEADKKHFEDEKAATDIETARSQEVAKWVEGTRVMQPVAVKIARSMPPEVRLNELLLERNEQLPNQLVLNVKFSGGSVQNVQDIETNVSQLNYRAYSPQQSKEGETIEYRSNLVWQQH